MLFLELAAVTTVSALLCVSLIGLIPRNLFNGQNSDEVGPIVYGDQSVTEPDTKLWEGIKKACAEAGK